MVGHAEGLLHTRESQAIEDKRLEVEDVGGVVVSERGQAGCALTSREPGDLVGVTDFTASPEDRAVLVQQLWWNDQAGREKSIGEIRSQQVDIEIAQRDQVLVEGIHLPRPASQPRGNGLQFRNAVGRVIPEEHVQRDQDEGFPACLERNSVRCTRELILKPCDQVCFSIGRDDEFGSQARKLYAARVEYERQALVVAGVAAGLVGENHRPDIIDPVEVFQHMAKCTQVAFDLLDRDDVEARDNLADVEQGA